MAHITGGGLKENIIRVVPEGLGIALDSASWTLPPVFDWLQREGNVAREEMWRTFNCGIGFTLIVARDARAATIAALAKLGLRRVADRRSRARARRRARAHRLSRYVARDHLRIAVLASGRGSNLAALIAAQRAR